MTLQGDLNHEALVNPCSASKKPYDAAAALAAASLAAAALTAAALTTAELTTAELSAGALIAGALIAGALAGGEAFTASAGRADSSLRAATAGNLRLGASIITI